MCKNVLTSASCKKIYFLPILPPESSFQTNRITTILVKMMFSIKSSCSGDQFLHLQASEHMLVWVFAYDQINYSRHFSYNWATQQQLHLTHPAIYHKIIKDHFSVKRARGNFNKLPPDQVIEQTINKEQKGSGGIIGISTSDGAIEKWILSSYIIAGLNGKHQRKCQLARRKNVPKDVGKARI